MRLGRRGAWRGARARGTRARTPRARAGRRVLYGGCNGDRRRRAIARAAGARRPSASGPHHRARSPRRPLPPWTMMPPGSRAKRTAWPAASRAERASYSALSAATTSRRRPAPGPRLLRRTRARGGSRSVAVQSHHRQQPPVQERNLRGHVDHVAELLLALRRRGHDESMPLSSRRLPRRWAVEGRRSPGCPSVPRNAVAHGS